MDPEEINIIPMDDGDGPIITLDIDDVGSLGNEPKSVNFGLGVELLMNDRKKAESSSPTADINLGDLNALEKELGEGESHKPSLREARSNIFAFQNPKKATSSSTEREELSASMERGASSRPHTPSIIKGMGEGGGGNENRLNIAGVV